MTVSTRLLLAASLCLAPLGWAAAQDQQQHDDQQHPRDNRDNGDNRDHKEQHPTQQQQHNQQQPQQGRPATQGQHGGRANAGGQGAGGQGSGGQQHPAQNNAAPPTPPAGATAAPTPPSRSQFQRVQGQPQTGGAAAPIGSAPPQQQQQQFQQRSAQRSGAPAGSAAPQAQQQQQQTTPSRANFQGNARGGNTAAFTQHHGGAAPTQFDRGHFYGHDYAHFSPHEVDLWHRGAWHHEFHDGRFGWWYAVDGIWYFYPQPIYPYPTFVPEIVYFPEEEAPVYVDAPPEPAPPQPVPPQYGQPPAYYYYFCQDTQTYYPYVSSCASPWQPVPAAPPQ